MLKIKKSLSRIYSKISDYIFYTENFHKYQMKYSGIYSNNYEMSEDQISFVHPPKSAGTSINTFLMENKVFIHNSAHNLVSIKCDPEKYKYITVIRDPIKRIKSFYEMQLNNKKLSFHNHAKKGLNFFVSKLKINQNCLCKFIIGNLDKDITEEDFKKVKKNLKNFFFIINFNKLEEDISKLKEKLDIDEEMKHIGKKKKSKIIDYSSENIENIIKFNKFDIKLYNDYITNN